MNRARAFVEAAQTGWCAACERPGFNDAHHVIRRQHVKRYIGSSPDVLWDPRNVLGLCRDCHERHTNRSRPVPRHVVPLAALDFAEDHGLTWLIEREYPDVS